MGHRPGVIWFTGLSGSGKTTIANAVENCLFTQFRVHTYWLDGDVLRGGLNRDLDFTENGRKENIRRISEVTRLFYDAGLIVLATFISPFRTERAFARSLIPDGRFMEIYVRCPLAVCEARDPKGLYQKVRQGKIANFTGIDSPYEEPLSPELILDSATTSLEDCAASVIDLLKLKRIL